MKHAALVLIAVDEELTQKAKGALPKLKKSAIITGESALNGKTFLNYYDFLQ